MSELKQRRISDVVFKIDLELNVLEASRGFQRLFNTVDVNINLKKYMNSSDRDNFIHFLKNFHEDIENPYFIVDFHSRGDFLNCILHISKDEEHFQVALQELSYVWEMLDRSIFENRKYHKIIGNFNTYFFTYDGKRFRMQNTKNLIDIFEGDLETFKTYFVDFFKINVTQRASARQVQRIFEDMSGRIADKKYRLLKLDGTSVSVRTSVFSTRERTEYIALVSTDDMIFDERVFTEKHDGLTNLYNKKIVTEMIINKIDVSKQKGSLFIIDVDKFKECNDTFGHAFGDKVLVAVAKVIRESVDGCGFAGRIGGDEFICFVDKTEEYDVRNIARSIRLGIQWAIPSLNPDSVVTSSIGIVRVPENATTYEEAFKIADKCLYIAKNKGRNCYIIYRPEMHDKMIRENEATKKSISSGKLFNDCVESEMKILTVIEKNRNNVKNCLNEVVPLLLEYLSVHKITFYRRVNGKFKISYTSGYENLVCRNDKFTDDYFKYFNEYGFFHADNVNVFDSLDKDKYNMYLKDEIASTLEVLCKNKAGSQNFLVCYDVFKPAQTFENKKITFGIMVARFIALLFE